MLVLLIEVVTKFTTILVYVTIFGGGHFIYGGGQELHVSQNGFTESTKNCSYLKNDFRGDSLCGPSLIIEPSPVSALRPTLAYLPVSAI
jgi:hypothetical protein